MLPAAPTTTRRFPGHAFGTRKSPATGLGLMVVFCLLFILVSSNILGPRSWLKQFYPPAAAAEISVVKAINQRLEDNVTESPQPQRSYAFVGYTDEELSIPLPPIQQFRRYIEQHSQKALMAEVEQEAAAATNHTSTTPIIQNRKYAVAYYRCPQRFGNFFHSFVNQVTWAMMYNRTILWAYDNITLPRNQESDCRQVLKRAEWIPGYHEWKDLLKLSAPVPIPGDNSTWKGQHQKDQVVIYPQIPDILAGDNSIARVEWSEFLRKKKFRAYMQMIPESIQTTTTKLFSEGVEFLFGMLFANIFQIRRLPDVTVVASPPGSTSSSSSPVSDFNQGETNYYSIGIHSRHIAEEDDGSFIHQEQRIIEKLLKKKKKYYQDTRPCKVFIMSDRPKTIDLLTNWLLQPKKNCSVVTANHHAGVETLRDEHGPWSGAGFLKDLFVVAQARDAIIGDTHRSSTRLLVELATYRSVVSEWQSENGGGSSDDFGAGLKIKKLPEKSVKGYDYGLGTPTFRGRWQKGNNTNLKAHWL